MVVKPLEADGARPIGRSRYSKMQKRAESLCGCRSSDIRSPFMEESTADKEGVEGVVLAQSR